MTLPDPPAHAWLLPKLQALLSEAAATGIAREVAVAVLTDLLGGPAFNTAAEFSEAKADPGDPAA